MIESSPGHRSALLSGLSAYLLWGTLPLYLTPLGKHIPAGLIVCQRVVWSVVLLVLVLTAKRGWAEVAAVIKTKRTLAALAISCVMISSNWLLFTYVITHKQALQAALGYFLTPLLSATLGMIFFKERLRPLQWAALVLAFCGVTYFTIALKVLPTFALLLAITFALYGLVRKIAPVDALTGLFVETVLLLIPASAILAWAWDQNISGGRPTGWLLLWIAIGCSLWTTIPLLLFAYAAKRLPLTTVGFLQYVGPTCQFCLAVFVFGEPFTAAYKITLPLIWLGVGLFMMDAVIRVRRGKPHPLPESKPPAPECGAAVSTR